MSTTTNLSGPGEQKIPSVDPSQLPAVSTTRTYVISAKIENGCVQFYFKSRPPVPDPTNDGPLDIRVPNNCCIVLQLDPALQWEFRSGSDGTILSDAVTLGDTARNFYFNLTVGSPQQVSFVALLNPSGDYTNNRDPYNVHVNLTQIIGSEPTPLAIRIDPDIENPGRL